MSAIPPPFPLTYEALVRRALREDLGRAGDLTTDALIADRHVEARIVVREAGRVAGLPVAAAAFRLLDATVAFEACTSEGCDVAPGTTLARLRGPARPILAAERTALNFLGRLCGIATATARAVAAVQGTRARIACTRKTTPGLRALEKYAVRLGGGANHRFGLDDGVLIKDNHLRLAGSLAAAVERVRLRVGHMVKIEVEVDSLEQLRQAAALGVDAVLLDNFGVAELREAVRLAEGKVLLEASGGITLEDVAQVAATGVHVISLGWLTHSAPALDVALEVT
ncbi:MAG: carboxylating nicotinate-nucleotide diphosphorylase [Gemmatimonadetes bacterium]|nr:carboxylating nicotinate-nucleotide diphosphorylase [Gemmatimonadota bacterium]